MEWLEREAAEHEDAGDIKDAIARAMAEEEIEDNIVDVFCQYAETVEYASVEWFALQKMLRENKPLVVNMIEWRKDQIEV